MLIKYNSVGFLQPIGQSSRGPLSSVRYQDFIITLDTETQILTLVDLGKGPEQLYKGETLHTYLHNMREGKPLLIQEKQPEYTVKPKSSK